MIKNYPLEVTFYYGIRLLSQGDILFFDQKLFFGGKGNILLWD
jgi:hypothetical protein